MTEMIMQGGDPQVALSHLALYGVAAILEDAGHKVRLSWTRVLNARPTLTAVELDDDEIGDAVLAHARAHAADDSWVRRDVLLKGKDRGLMSPRLSALTETTWPLIQQGRHTVLDELTKDGAWLDLQMIAALGEPCYWSQYDGNIRQDHGASRWEMQPRNQGSEFVGTRLRKLAATVAARSADAVTAGLTGLRIRDEAGDDKPNSSTATGLAGLGPVDNALAWCALWGISQLPTSARINKVAITCGHVAQARQEWFYTPVWHKPWRPARLRTILTAPQFRLAAAAGLPGEGGPPPPVQLAAARAWLSARGIAGLIRFPIEHAGTDKAPIRRAQRGRPIPLVSSS